MRFVKFHGYGNDYIVFEEHRLNEVSSLNSFARQVCDRHYGAGADGIAVVGRAQTSAADFTVRIFNQDGSEAAMSGNGTRCAAAYLYHQELWSAENLRLQTQAGVKGYYQLPSEHSEHRESSRGGTSYRFRAELGRPIFDNTAIPMLTEEPLAAVTHYPLVVAGETVAVTALLMCNPNCCIFVDDFDVVDWRRLGRTIEHHRQFPNRTNVEFVRVRDWENIEVRIWERGVGETLASGTGACAAAVAACLNDKTGRRVNVETPGGILEVEWRAADGEVMLTGTAEVIYQGEWLQYSVAERFKH